MRACVRACVRACKYVRVYVHISVVHPELAKLVTVSLLDYFYMPCQIFQLLIYYHDYTTTTLSERARFQPNTYLAFLTAAIDKISYRLGVVPYPTVNRSNRVTCRGGR